MIYHVLSGNMIQFINRIQFYTILYNKIICSKIPFDTIQCSTIKYTAISEDNLPPYNVSKYCLPSSQYKILSALLLYFIYFFFEKIQQTTSIPIYTTLIFWIAVAFTIYCSGNFFVFLYSNNAVSTPQTQFQYTIIYSTSTILKNILLCIGISIKQSKNNEGFSDYLNTDSFFQFPENEKV